MGDSLPSRSKLFYPIHLFTYPGWGQQQCTDVKKTCVSNGSMNAGVFRYTEIFCCPRFQETYSLIHLFTYPGWGQQQCRVKYRVEVIRSFGNLKLLSLCAPGHKKTWLKLRRRRRDGPISWFFCCPLYQETNSLIFTLALLRPYA